MVEKELQERTKTEETWVLKRTWTFIMIGNYSCCDSFCLYSQVNLVICKNNDSSIRGFECKRNARLATYFPQV